METSLTSPGVFALLGLGLVFGLKHATEVDHVVAVSTIVSEHRNVWRATLVGGLWGAGHTASLVLVGVLVLVFRVAVPLSVARWLEFGVALMIIGLGVVAMMKVLRRRADVHLHRHSHDGQPHVHIHFHEDGTEHARLAVSQEASRLSAGSHSHAISRLGLKPLLVGGMHGLAGSAALTLLVLTQIQSVWLGLLYLALFGIGSTLGMMLMSGFIGLPFALSGRRLTSINYGLQSAAGGLSIAFGLWYAYETVVTNSLWRTVL
jgi:ABC-type nickel/cobalt efflux system permease component RcnA